MLNPAFEAKGGKPKRPAPPRSTYFAMGEITKRYRDALRVADSPVSAAEVALRPMVDKGLDLTDQKIRSDMISRINQTLHRLTKDESIRRVGYGLGVRWDILGIVNKKLAEH